MERTRSVSAETDIGLCQQDFAVRAHQVRQVERPAELLRACHRPFDDCAAFARSSAMCQPFRLCAKSSRSHNMVIIGE